MDLFLLVGLFTPHKDLIINYITVNICIIIQVTHVNFFCRTHLPKDYNKTIVY